MRKGVCDFNTAFVGRANLAVAMFSEDRHRPGARRGYRRCLRTKKPAISGQKSDARVQPPTATSEVSLLRAKAAPAASEASDLTMVLSPITMTSSGIVLL